MVDGGNALSSLYYECDGHNNRSLEMCILLPLLLDVD